MSVVFPLKQDATTNAVEKMKASVDHGYGCAIAIDKNGNFGKATNSLVMLWAKAADGKLDIGSERRTYI